MVAAKNEKLNHLQRSLPEGLVVDTGWLDAHGYPKSLRDKYLASGWLEHVSRGVYRRPSALVSEEHGRLQWERVVLSLQHLLKLGVSVGGRTALELQGFAHHLRSSDQREVHLYASEPLPGWLDTIPANARWLVHNPDRLFASAGRGLSSSTVDVRDSQSHSLDPIHGAFQMSLGLWDWPLTASTAERAVLELLDELPTHESFEQVDALFGGLGALSPRRLQRLLEDCRSVKVKRLFFVFADRHAHGWLRHLKRERVDLGAGKRALVPNGKLDRKYQITLPSFLLSAVDADQ